MAIPSGESPPITDRWALLFVDPPVSWVGCEYPRPQRFVSERRTATLPTVPLALWGWWWYGWARVVVVINRRTRVKYAMSIFIRNNVVRWKVMLITEYWCLHLVYWFVMLASNAVGLDIKSVNGSRNDGSGRRRNGFGNRIMHRGIAEIMRGITWARTLRFLVHFLGLKACGRPPVLDSMCAKARCFYTPIILTAVQAGTMAGLKLSPSVTHSAGLAAHLLASESSRSVVQNEALGIEYCGTGWSECMIGIMQGFSKGRGLRVWMDSNEPRRKDEVRLGTLASGFLNQT